MKSQVISKYRKAPHILKMYGAFFILFGSCKQDVIDGSGRELSLAIQKVVQRVEL